VLDPDAGAAGVPEPRARRSSTLRVLRLELRRARAGVLAALVVLVCALLLTDTSAHLWPGRWLHLTISLRAVVVPYVVPLVVAVAVWRGQRVHRAGIGELLASTPRPRRDPLVLDWLVVTLPAAAGVLVTWSVAAVAPSLAAEPGRVRAPGWLGGHWELLLLAGVAGLAAVAALGLTVGRAISSRFAAPTAGALAAVVAMFVAIDLEDGVAWLTPGLPSAGWVSDTVPARASLLQIGFFAAVTVAALAAAHLVGPHTGSRRSPVWTLVAALTVAVVCAVPLVTGTGRLVPDQAALQPVCTREVPVVCVQQVNSFFLGDVAAQLRPVLAAVVAAGGPSDVRLERPEEFSDDGPAVRLNLETGLDGRLTRNAEANWIDADGFARAFADSHRCRSEEADPARPGPDRDWLRAEPIAADLLIREAGGRGTGLVEPDLRPAVEAMHQRLVAAPPAERRAWLTAYFQARSTCDDRAAAALVRLP
jgi:hypothetical protein